MSAFARRPHHWRRGEDGWLPGGLGGQDVGLGWDHIEHTLEDGDSVFYTDIDEETLRNSPVYERD
jgi:hypothetical protein